MYVGTFFGWESLIRYISSVERVVIECGWMTVGLFQSNGARVGKAQKAYYSLPEPDTAMRQRKITIKE